MYCLIPNARCLDSNTELIYNDILKVFSTDIEQADVVTHLVPLMSVHDFKLTWLPLAGKVCLPRAKPLLDDQFALMSILPIGALFLSYFYLKIS